MRTLKLHFPDDALPTLDTFLLPVNFSVMELDKA